jgi:hypothetical protein
MLDINGQPIEEGRLALLLCEVLAIEPDGVRIRIMNSDMELSVGAKVDEVLGGMVADSELTAFVETPAEPEHDDSQADEVKILRFE